MLGLAAPSKSCPLVASSSHGFSQLYRTTSLTTGMVVQLGGIILSAEINLVSTEHCPGSASNVQQAQLYESAACGGIPKLPRLKANDITIGHDLEKLSTHRGCSMETWASDHMKLPNPSAHARSTLPLKRQAANVWVTATLAIHL